MIDYKPKIRGRVTQRDIAQAVGVSHVAVSHALHRPHHARISPETKKEILRVAREMNYQPRYVTTHTIAFVVDTQDLWWGQTTNLLVYADEALRQHGFRMAVVMVNDDDIAAGKEKLSSKTVDGAIFTEWHDGKIRRLIAPDVPWVLTADEDSGLGEDVDQVAMDTVGTAAKLTRYLCERGHERICLLTGDVGIGFHKRLQRGLYQGLNEMGLPLDNATVIATKDRQQERDEISDKLLRAIKKKKSPSAVLTGNLGGAMVVLNQLQRAGYSVPEDMSIVCCTDSPRLEALQPSITATTATGREAAEKAVMRLIRRIKQPETVAERVLSPGEIIERESVADRR